MTELETPGSAALASSSEDNDQQLGLEDDYDLNSDEELQEAFAAGVLQPGLTRLVPKAPKQKKVNNVQALMQKLADLKPDKALPWIERLDLSCKPAPLAPELALEESKAEEKAKKSAKNPKAAKTQEDLVHNDFKRELIFYRQAQAAVLEALPRLKSMGMKTKRPDDYFAQMAKSDAQMNKIRGKLVSKQATEERLEKIRKLRELRKYGKKVQVEVQQKRQKEKREMLEQVKKFRKGQADSIDFLDQDNNQKKKTKRAQEQQRKAKDKKFGFGGKKKGLKSNTRDSANDISEYKPFRKKGRPGTPAAPPGGKAKKANLGSKLKQKRLGKNRRKQQKARKK